MVFSSYIFIAAFLPAFLVVYFGARVLGKRAPGFRILWLIVGSYVFYGWEKYAYIALILSSTVVDYVCARGMSASDDGSRRKRLLIVSIVTNLGLLGFFKYRNLVIDALNLGGGDIPHLLPSWTLPVGISFYTFQSMSYTIDVYRGIVPPVRRFADFMCYVSLFPQLVAGPIVRYRDIADQLVDRRHTLEKFATGVFLFMIGWGKKTLIANNVGVLAAELFETQQPGLLDAWIGMLGYTCQIYFDFSGYSDMAIGLGMMLGFVFPKNFESPYKAQSITDFWRRWHISLSTWLRDYLYIPLGGNKKGRLRTYVNLMLTMLLGGLWHGASWTFILWGAWHGAWLALERRLGKRAPWARLPSPARCAFTFFLVMIGWIMFKAGSASQLADVASGFFGLHGLGDLTLRGPRPVWLPLFALAVALPIAFFGRTSLAMSENVTWPKALLAVVLFVLGIEQVLQHGFNPFLYFQF